MGHSAFISTFPVCHLIGAAESGDGYVSFIVIAQASHGFAQDDWVYNNAGTYTAAQADAAATIAWGAVGRVIDANSFELVLEGIVTSLSHGIGNAADSLYLSQASAGVEVTTVPASGIVQPIGLVLSADQYYVHIMGAEWI